MPSLGTGRAFGAANFGLIAQLVNAFATVRISFSRSFVAEVVKGGGGSSSERSRMRQLNPTW